MCVVSAMGDHYDKQFDPFKRYIPPHNPIPSFPDPIPQNPFDWTKAFINQVSRLEFEELKRQVEDMKKILKVAVEYDKSNNEPHCEIETKVRVLKEIAKLVGVDLNDVFPTASVAPLSSFNVTYNPNVPYTLTANSGSL